MSVFKNYAKLFRLYKETNLKEAYFTGARKTNININPRLEISSKRSEEGGGGMETGGPDLFCV